MWYGMSTKRNMINLFTFLLFILLKTCFLYSKHTKCIDKKNEINFYSYSLFFLSSSSRYIMHAFQYYWCSLNRECVIFVCITSSFFELIFVISILCWNGFYTNIGKHFPEKLIWFSFFFVKIFFLIIYAWVYISNTMIWHKQIGHSYSA